MGIIISKEDKIRQLVIKRRELSDQLDCKKLPQNGFELLAQLGEVSEELTDIISEEIYTNIFKKYGFSISEIEEINYTLLERAKSNAIVR